MRYRNASRAIRPLRVATGSVTIVGPLGYNRWQGDPVRAFDREEAVRLLKAGESMAALARRFGVSEDRIRRAARKAGLPPMPSGRPLRNQGLDPANVLARYRSGVTSITRLAEDVDASWKAVKDILVAAGEQPRRQAAKHRPNPIRPIPSKYAGVGVGCVPVVVYLSHCIRDAVREAAVRLGTTAPKFVHWCARREVEGPGPRPRIVPTAQISQPRVQIEVEAELYASLRAMAARSNVSMSGFLAAVVEKHLSEPFTTRPRDMDPSAHELTKPEARARQTYDWLLTEETGRLTARQILRRFTDDMDAVWGIMRILERDFACTISSPPRGARRLVVSAPGVAIPDGERLITEGRLQEPREESLAVVLRVARAALGLTQRAVAKGARISTALVARAEWGYVPSTASLMRIADVLNEEPMRLIRLADRARGPSSRARLSAQEVSHG